MQGMIHDIYYVPGNLIFFKCDLPETAIFYKYNGGDFVGQRGEVDRTMIIYMPRYGVCGRYGTTSFQVE